jgi:starch-binding outer membrane protein SusE/F
MKSLYKNLLLAGVALLGLGACEKDEVKAVLIAGTVPTVTVSSANVVLTKENADKDALTISWAKPEYGFAAPAAYTVLLDKKGSNFANAVALATGSDLRKTVKTAELNALLLKLGIAAGTTGDVDVRVQSVLGPSTTLSSAVTSMKATTYLDKLDLSSNWGIVGPATPGGWNGPDLPFYKSEKANVFVAYVSLAAGELKFRQDNKWDVNLGDTKGDGMLKSNGDNVVIKATGTYKVTLDLTTNKYSIDKFSWGVVGSATPSGWAAPDMPFMYDPSSDQWRAIVTLKEGEIKFRQSEDWAVNYGDTKADGVLDAAGDNILVKAGTYLITTDFKTLKYTIVPFKVWGLVGSATVNGWNGPDAKFMPDFGNEGVWKLNNVKLVDGDIKFRQNDDWAVNIGDTKADGILDDAGDNIVVKAGTYDILLDLSVASKRTYKLTKK